MPQDILITDRDGWDEAPEWIRKCSANLQTLKILPTFGVDPSCRRYYPRRSGFSLSSITLQTNLLDVLEPLGLTKGGKYAKRLKRLESEPYRIVHVVNLRLKDQQVIRQASA